MVARIDKKMAAGGGGDGGATVAEGDGGGRRADASVGELAAAGLSEVTRPAHPSQIPD